MPKAAACVASKPLEPMMPPPLGFGGIIGQWLILRCHQRTVFECTTLLLKERWKCYADGSVRCRAVDDCILTSRGLLVCDLAVNSDAARYRGSFSLCSETRYHKGRVVCDGQ